MTTEYASAVAAVRAMEEKLLSSDDMTRLINAANYREFADILRSAGRNVPDTDAELQSSLDNELDDVWQFITEYTGKSSALEMILYKNDFHNLKAALKALMMNTSPQRLFITPSNLELEKLPEVVSAKNWEELPSYMHDCAADVYEILTRTMDGQLADAVADRACLMQMQLAAKKTGIHFLIKLAELMTVCADIKTAYRCSRMKKQEVFLESALCGCPELDKNSLLKSAVLGTDELMNFLEGTVWCDAAELLKSSPAAFEKWCDNRLVELIGEARMKSFGIEPLAAYFIAKETEIKNLRIILVCKECGISRSAITERMRELYV